MQGCQKPSICKKNTTKSSTVERGVPAQFGSGTGPWELPSIPARGLPAICGGGPIPKPISSPNHFGMGCKGLSSHEEKCMRLNMEIWPFDSLDYEEKSSPKQNNMGLC